MSGMQKYTDIRGPALAIYAVPHATGQTYKDDTARVAAEARDQADTGAQAKHLRAEYLPRGSFACRTRIYVFLSNKADVLREMNAFLGSLPQQN